MISSTIPSEDDEIRKHLTSELATGRPIIVLDNADDRQTLHSPSLASVITAETWTDRVLGKTNMVTVPNDAVWMMTGNNPRLDMELARRCIRIRILSKSERPHLEGGFKYDPLNEWMLANRAVLVRAVLVLVRAWLAAGRPPSKRRLGSFERWTQTVGGILDNAGIPGFLDNLEELYEAADAEGDAWREFVSTWWDEAGDYPQKVVDLNDLCERKDLLTSLRGDGSPRSQQTRLGSGLVKKRDRVFAGKRIIREGKKGHTNCIRYFLNPVPTHESDDTQPDGGKGHTNTSVQNARTCENLKNEVLAFYEQGSRSEVLVVPDGYTKCENLREPFGGSYVKETTTTPHNNSPIIGTCAQELNRIWEGEREGSRRFSHSDATPGNHETNDARTSSARFSHPPVILNPTGQPTDSTIKLIDLADYPDEGELQ